MSETETEKPAPKDLGWANNWKENPPEYIACVEAKHDRTDKDIGPPNRGMHHVVDCEKCNIRYHYDSSD